MIKKLWIIISLCFILTTQASALNNASLMIHGHEGKETFKIMQIALYEDGKFIYKEPFTSLEAFDEKMPSLEKKQLAKKVQTIIEANQLCYEDKKETDEKGKVKFDHLPLGLYFLTKEGNDDYLMDPFLINLPLKINEQWVYHLNVEPKFEKVPEKQEENKPTTADQQPVLFYTYLTLGTLSLVIYLSSKVKKQTS